MGQHLTISFIEDGNVLSSDYQAGRDLSVPYPLLFLNPKWTHAKRTCYLLMRAITSVEVLEVIERAVDSEREAAEK